MILEFENGFIPEHLFLELGFQPYLEQFKQEIPVLSRQILRPLEFAEATAHFGRLAQLQRYADDGHLDLKAVMRCARELPNLESLLPLLQGGQLESFHLFELGHYLQQNQGLQNLETAVTLPCRKDPCPKILKILLRYTRGDFSSLKLSGAETDLRDSLNLLSRQLDSELSAYEQEILDQTGVRFIYPYPKEIGKDDKHLQKLLQSNLLNLVDKGDVYLADYRLVERIKQLLRDKASRQLKWRTLMKTRLNSINDALRDFHQPLADYYRQRKERIFQYLLLSAAKAGNLTLPELTPESQIQVTKGILPLLKQHEGKRYMPLNLSLKSGANVLFGANMTGKTTVLKTLYFQLVLVKFGLPVPAQRLVSLVPEDLGLHLRSSGKATSGLSGFGEELRFFCDMNPDSSVYMVDELFHSTDPVNGVELTDAFLRALSENNSIFICTTHYQEVLEISGIQLLRMKDVEPSRQLSNLDRFLKKVPYEVESLTPETAKNKIENNRTPIQIALQFPLPGAILNNLNQKLEQ